MKLTKRVLSLLLPGVAAASLMAGCDSDDPVKSGADQGQGGALCADQDGPVCISSVSGLLCPDGISFSCGQGEQCVDGACVGQCEPKATECVGEDAYRACSNDGKQWAVVACQPGQKCDDGACREVAPSCSAGETQCADGKTQQVCQADGTLKDVKCPSGTACTDGACVGECEVGASRCELSTHNLTDAIFSQALPNFGVVWKCVDGKQWTMEACGEGEYCSYSGVSADETERYRKEFMEFYIVAQASGGGGLPTLPRAPELPKSAQASCTADPCGAAGFFGEGEFKDNPESLLAFFESPNGVRMCGVPGGEEEEEIDWTKFSQCSGLPPYAPLKLETYQCPAELQCNEDYPQSGCFPVTQLD